MPGQNQFIIYTFLFILNINKTSGISEKSKDFYEGCVSVEDERKVTFDTVEAYQRNNVSFEYGVPNFRGDLVDFNIPSIKMLYNNSFENTYDMWVRGLFLQRKAIYAIQDGAFHSLKCLRTLVLSKNFIKTLRRKMFKGLSMLFELDLSGNMITSLLSNTFNYVTNLQKLDLSHNLIKFIEVNTFSKLKLLHTLNLSYNKLDAVQLEVFEGAKLLKVLDLSYCNMTDLKSVSNAESLLQELQILNISHNKLHSGIPRVGYRGLLELHLESNKLLHFDVSMLHNCPQLREFYIDDNDMECKELQKIQTELKSYNITTTKFDECPKFLPESKALFIFDYVFASACYIIVVLLFVFIFGLICGWVTKSPAVDAEQRIAGFPHIAQPAHAVQALQPGEFDEGIVGVELLIPVQQIEQVERIEQVRQVEPAQRPIRIAVTPI